MLAQMCPLVDPQYDRADPVLERFGVIRSDDDPATQLARPHERKRVRTFHRIMFSPFFVESAEFFT